MVVGAGPGGSEFTVNFGDCAPLRQPMKERHRGYQTRRSDLFSVGRRVYERPWREVELNWPVTTLGTAESVLRLYESTLGGVLLMRYKPGNGEANFDLRFSEPPRIIQTGPLTFSVVLMGEERFNEL